MQHRNKILQGIGIPHSAFLSVIFGMMILSFPLGAYVVFHSEIGDDINYNFPLNQFELFTVGDIFIILWSMYIIFFTIAMVGPKEGFLQNLSSLISNGRLKTQTNYLVAATQGFSILILVSVIINFIQEGFGITTVPPIAENNLIQFLHISLAPISEEIGFRVILIGLPLFAFYSHRSSVKYFFKSLWSPYNNLHIYDSRRAIILIIIVSVFFGIAHIISGEPWSSGKFAQATASGMILGWLYFRFGIIPAILVHWATNYFIFSYVHFISQINLISIEDSFSHPIISLMEILFLISGALSISVVLIHYFYSKKENRLNV